MKLDVRDQSLYPRVIGSGETGDNAARRRPVIYVGQSWDGWCDLVIVVWIRGGDRCQ